MNLLELDRPPSEPDTLTIPFSWMEDLPLKEDTEDLLPQEDYYLESAREAFREAFSNDQSVDRGFSPFTSRTKGRRIRIIEGKRMLVQVMRRSPKQVILVQLSFQGDRWVAYKDGAGKLDGFVEGDEEEFVRRRTYIHEQAKELGFSVKRGIPVL
jgi:hypothetical protein